MKNKKYRQVPETNETGTRDTYPTPATKKKRAQQYNTLDIHDTYMTYILAYKLHFF